MDKGEKELASLVSGEMSREDWAAKEVVDFSHKYLRSEKAVKELIELVENALESEPYRGI